MAIAGSTMMMNAVLLLNTLQDGFNPERETHAREGLFCPICSGDASMPALDTLSSPFFSIQYATLPGSFSLSDPPNSIHKPPHNTKSICAAV